MALKLTNFGAGIGIGSSVETVTKLMHIWINAWNNETVGMRFEIW